MMRTIGQAELAGMDLRRRVVKEASEGLELDWLERHPALCAVVGPIVLFGAPAVMIAVLYAIAKARGM
ncbi:MAG: hypothetical protein IKO01_09170 [Kiritimatiellae bacterium]|nr:hypothetical protein [Kiritimatiellia bacterium]